MQIIVANFSTEYKYGDEETEYFECSEWGFKKALKWCEARLPFDKDHTPIYWKNYIRSFTPEQIQKWTDDFINDNSVYVYGLQYSSEFTIRVVDVVSKEDEEREDEEI
jgi:hypothetical protein